MRLGRGGRAAEGDFLSSDGGAITLSTRKKGKKFTLDEKRKERAIM